MIIQFGIKNQDISYGNIYENDFNTNLYNWLYYEKYGTIRDSSFDRMECVLKHQICPAIKGLKHIKLLIYT